LDLSHNAIDSHGAIEQMVRDSLPLPSPSPSHLRQRRRSQVSFFEAVQRCSALETINLSGNRTFSLDVKARPASPSGRPSLWHSYTVEHSLAAPAC
jgi:hypothetical protein